VLRNHLEYYDFGARMYDPRIGRWISTDPLSEERLAWTAYNALRCNPIKNVDIDGLLDDWYIKKNFTENDNPVWLPSDEVATSVFGSNSFINLGENLLKEVTISSRKNFNAHDFYVPKYLINAKSEYGQKDSQHKNQLGENKRIIEYHSTTTNPTSGHPFQSDKIAWCASFVNWNLVKSGYPSNNNKFNATATGYNKWNEQYFEIKKPALGAIAVINNSHVTFIIGINGNDIHGYGGNQASQVKVSTFFNPKKIRYFLPKGEIPNYNVPVINFNFNSNKNESTK
ncbi:MAG: hypothetical protein L6Q78_15875, partial [Bacteroidia bacterium]|nr:hypothetical protein [Bacteroidia bacterium]